MKTIGILLLGTVVAQAQLAVTVSPVKVTGQKAVVPLALNNNFAEKIESARAVCFLTDEQGKVLGQSTKWVIGDRGANPDGIGTGATNSFYFVVPIQRADSTNLVARVTFSRLVLPGGRLADPNRDVQVQAAAK